MIARLRRLCGLASIAICGAIIVYGVLLAVLRGVSLL